MKTLRDWRSLLQRSATAVTWVLLVAALLGHALRDRVLSFALFSYFPLLGLGAWAIALALVLRRDSAHRASPAALAIAGALSASWAMASTFGSGALPSASAQGVPVRVLQQNILWGGGVHATRATWRTFASELRAKRADILVLSECPQRAWLEELRAQLSHGEQPWSLVWIEHEPDARDWFRVAVLARWPVRTLGELSLDQGRALDVEVAVPSSALHLLAVDGLSEPTRDRPAMLRDIESVLERARRDGHPVDVLAGDFNAPSRSVAFDRLRHDYRLASDHAAGWRATWPSPVPWLDLDQVWVARTRALASVQLYTSRRSDHRGQVVDLR